MKLLDSEEDILECQRPQPSPPPRGGVDHSPCDQCIGAPAKGNKVLLESDDSGSKRDVREAFLS